MRLVRWLAHGAVAAGQVGKPRDRRGRELKSGAVMRSHGVLSCSATRTRLPGSGVRVGQEEGAVDELNATMATTCVCHWHR